MNTKRWMKWVIVLVLLAALPVMTVALAQGEQPGKQLPAVIGSGESGYPTANVNESESNNSFASADVLNVGDVISGKINGPGDADYFKVPVLEWYSAHLLFNIDAQALGSPLDAYLCVYDPNMAPIDCDDDTDGFDSLVFYTNHYPGNYSYYVKVTDLGGNGGNAYEYRLSVFAPLFVSAAASGLGTGTVAGITFKAADILAHYDFGDGTEKWLMFLEAADVGITKNVANITMHEENEVYMVFQVNQPVMIDGQSIVLTPYHVGRFRATELGRNSAGEFFSAWDYRPYGLSTASEKFDALTLNGSVPMFSSVGTTAAPWLGKAQDEDLFNCCGENWFDGTRVSGLKAEDVIAAEWEWGEDVFYLTIAGTGRIDGQNFSQKDIFMVDGNTYELMGRYWNGPEHHFNYNIDAFEVAFDE